MKNPKTNIKIPTRFEPDTRFEVQPVTFRALLETEFEALKERLLNEVLATQDDHRLNAAFRRAANEAASLVWATPFPQLLFPELFREKALAARVQTFKQESILRRSRALVAVAA